MKYKKSFYNVEVEDLSNDKKVLYNTFSGMFGSLDKENLPLYDNIENINVNEITNQDALRTLHTMAVHGFIVPHDKDELGVIKIQRATHRYNHDTLYMTIAPTMDCNMCCPYCYEDKSSLVMDDKTQEQLVTFAEKHLDTYKHIKNLNISWYGGEPLLQKEVIYNLSNKLIGLSETRNIGYSAHIVTNGVLMDLETSKKLAEDCKVNSVQITIDGMKEMHNKRRILVDGNDSHEIIIKNIEDSKDVISISVRVNVDKENVEDIDKLTKFFFEEKGWLKNPFFYLAPVEKYTEFCSIDKSTCLYGEEFADLVDKNNRARYAFDRDTMAHGFFPSRKQLFCSAEGVMSYVIASDGLIYACWQHIGVEERNTGHISRPLAVNPEYTKWLLVDFPEKCDKCTYLPMCQGGCGQHRVYGEEPQCFHTFYTYKNTLKLAYEDYVVKKAKTAKTDAATPVS